MKPARLLCLLACLALAHCLPSALAEPAVWERIAYPLLPIPGAEKGQMRVMIGSGGRLGEESHLRFDLLWVGSQDSHLPTPISEPSNIAVKLHTGDGKVALPQSKPRWIGAGGSLGMTWGLTFTFPWSRNALDEAWIELDVASQVYWIELPYGFARNPADPEPSNPKQSWPKFPPAMNNLADKDILVPWLYVDYDLGEIQNHWRVSLQLSNPFDAHAEIILYRDDSQVGKSMYLWNLETPVTAMKIEWPGSSIMGFKTSVHLHEDGMRRSDIYKFNRDSSSDMERDWGTVEVKVDDKSYSLRVPSSLFKYVHGITDNGNKHRMVVPSSE
jgi:hypothetical protein